MWTQKQHIKIYEFLNILKTIEWFKTAGTTSSKFKVTYSIFDAWDNWNSQMLIVWDNHSQILEKTALEILTNEQIDNIFELVLQTVSDTLYNNFCVFEEDHNLQEEFGLENEIMEFMERDIAWACIEYIIDKQGFFTKVYQINKSGRWACSWDGNYPDGRFVVM